MDKYVYCHDSGEYSGYGSLEAAESEIFETLRDVTGVGTFLYAPTTRGKALAYSYTQANGFHRIDAYKGQIDEMDPNPAKYIGNLRVEKPYHEPVNGALPLPQGFNAGGISVSALVRLVECVLLGNAEQEIIITGRDISRRVAEYLKALFYLLPPSYARRVGFCINKYLRYDLQNANVFYGEKPSIRIYALDSDAEFPNAYIINLDGSVPNPDDSNMPVKALRLLIDRGVSRENLTAVSRATEAAFGSDGSFDAQKYKRCLVKAAYAYRPDLGYAEEIVGFGFSNPDERRLFSGCVAYILENGSLAQKKSVAGKAIELLRDNLGEVEEPLLNYIVSSATEISPKEHALIVRTAVRQLASGEYRASDDSALVTKFLNSSSPSWRAKYEVLVDIIQDLLNADKRSAAYAACRVLADRFNPDRLANVQINESVWFDLKPNIGAATRDAVYASLLKNDCENTQRRYARVYCGKDPRISDILRIRCKIIEIFDIERCDFIFGDTQCERFIKTKIGKLPLSDLQSLYDGPNWGPHGYANLQSEMLLEIFRAENRLGADERTLEWIKQFLTDADRTLQELGEYLGEDKLTKLRAEIEDCRQWIVDNGNEQNARENILQFCGAFSARFSNLLPSPDKKKGRGKRGEKKGLQDESLDSQVPTEKIVAEQFKNVINSYQYDAGPRLGGLRAYSYGVALCLLAGLIAVVIMFVPAVCLAALVGDLTLSTVFMYLSRYFYAAIAVPIIAVLLCGFLRMLAAFKEDGKAAFGVTALCIFIPSLIFGVGYVLVYLLFT